MSQEKEKEMVSVQRYVDILSNGGFKALFGDRNNKAVVISILNALLPLDRQVEDIEYMPTEYSGQTQENKDYRYDFMCHGPDGTSFIVETQRYYESNWFRRCVSYASRMYDLQNPVGGDYSAPPVYLIGLMGVEVNHPDRELWRDRYISEYTFREKETHDLLDDTIFIIFAELASFDKRQEECVSDLDRMLYLLKNTGNLKKRSSWLRREIYSRILDACEIARFSKDKRIQYNKDMIDERRRQGELDAAMKMGMEKGREEGKRAAIRTMLAAGVPVEEIAKAFSMTEEECRDL